jgi:hypothetical protein
MNRLIRPLRFEDAPPAEVSREFSKIEEDMEEEWVTFGRLSSAD